MYEYTINQNYSVTAFKNACSRIEKLFPHCEKERLYVDILDDDMIQIYHKDGKLIKVVNDFLVDAVYVESEVSLNRLFGIPSK